MNKRWKHSNENQSFAPQPGLSKFSTRDFFGRAAKIIFKLAIQTNETRHSESITAISRPETRVMTLSPHDNLPAPSLFRSRKRPDRTFEFVKRQLGRFGRESQGIFTQIAALIKNGQ